MKIPPRSAHRINLAIIGVCGVSIAASIAFTQTWTQTAAPSLDWLSIASSADGSHLLAGGYSVLCTSTNAGASWTTNNVPTHDWTCAASSADGNQLAAAVGYPDTGRIYLSTNGGGMWTTSTVPSKQWISLTMSADGTKLMALPSSGPLYLSSDSGTTWVTNAIPTTGLTRISSASNGNQWAAIKSGGAVFVSTNFGVSWASNNVGASPFDSPTLTFSADGSTLVAAQGGNGGVICISTNLGVFWNTNTLRKVWNSVAASADGRHLIAGSYPDIYTSSDLGMTWISNNAPRLTWRAVAISADGNALVAATFPGGIYTLQTTPTPSLDLKLTANSNLWISWVTPSSNFVMQQSSDLTSWSDATNVPTLDLTNFQNNVILPASFSNGFYRLATPSL